MAMTQIIYSGFGELLYYRFRKKICPLCGSRMKKFIKKINLGANISIINRKLFFTSNLTELKIYYYCNQCRKMRTLSETYTMRKGVKFYDDLKKAIFSNDLINKNVTKTIKKVIKIVEEGEDCIVFFIGADNNKDSFYMYKIKKKEYEQKIYYSTPVLKNSCKWSKRRKEIISNILSSNKTKKLIKQVNEDLERYKGINAVYFGDINKSIKWGLALDSDINNLKINEIMPTEIIEITLDNDKVYFWYYENLEIADKELYKLKISF